EGSRVPERTLVRVVLPAPLRPTSPTRSPAVIWKETSLIRSRAPTRMARSCTVITGGLLFGRGRRDRARAARGPARAGPDRVWGRPAPGVREYRSTVPRTTAGPRPGTARGTTAPGPAHRRRAGVQRCGSPRGSAGDMLGPTARSGAGSHSREARYADRGTPGGQEQREPGGAGRCRRPRAHRARTRRRGRGGGRRRLPRER